MANRWFLYISELAQKAQQEVTKTPENWQKFLTTASRFYKSYDFDDQLLIYIQRPDAVACADIETWNNKMHRWVNAGSNAAKAQAADPISRTSTTFPIPIG